MGKRGKKFGGSNRGSRKDYAVIEKKNEKFEQYYNGLGIVPEEEQEELWEALRRNLPNSFRFTGSRKHALAVQERLKEFYIPNIVSIRYEGELVEPPRPVPWYPDQLAWSMTTPKQVVRRFPPFASFQKFLVSETEVGNISRQEIVSMIPPLLLDVRPGMVVLDMCAAPGSKSAQLMEMIHAGEEEQLKKVTDKLEADSSQVPLPGKVDIQQLLNAEEGDDTNNAAVGFEDDGRSTGLLIANDSDSKRAHMLIHQMKRLNSPNLLVTNHDATMYPSIKLPPLIADQTHNRNRYLKFDRILADVPCSGDGTTRKNINVWKDWNPANGIGLHLTQSRILVRALQMLKVGGRVVYSTCSMNPVENEAVVATAIGRCGGSDKVEIIDCSNDLPGLKRSPGLMSWTVMDKQGRVWDSWDAVEKETALGDDTLKRLTEGMFPPSVEGKPDLTRCMRVYPHQQDTGGFFITVLEKKSEIRARPEGQKATPAIPIEVENPSPQDMAPTLVPVDTITAPSDCGEINQKADLVSSAELSASKRDSDHLDGEPETKRAKVSNEPATLTASVKMKPIENAISRPRKQRPGQSLEEPFKYLNPTLEEFDTIFEFYSLSSRFPRDRFMVRNAEGRPTKTIYYTTALARDILTENEGSGMKFVHCGVKMFVKQDVQRPDVCPWRIQKDGLSLLEPLIGTKRTVKIYKKATLHTLLVEMFPKVNDGGWKNLGELGEWAKEIDMGCCVLKLEPTSGEDGFHERMILPLWRSLHSLNLMLPKEERRAMLLRLFNDETPLINTTQKKEAATASAMENGLKSPGAEELSDRPEDGAEGERLPIGGDEAES